MSKVNESTNYKWVILATTVLVVFAALGLSQFSYPAILPAMQKGLHINNTLAGILATANLMGYLGMAVVAGAVATRLGPRRVITAGLLLAAAGMIVTGIANGFGMAAAGRFLTGIGSATASVPAHLVPSFWFPPQRRGVATGALPLGASMGLVMSGPLVPRLVNGYGESGWRITWFVLAAVTFVIALLAFAVIRSHGSSDTEQCAPDHAAPDHAEPRRSLRHIYLSPVIWHLNAIYFAFGFAYMTYMTFFTKRLIADIGYTAAGAGRLFMVMGLVSIVCGTLWGLVSDRVGRKWALTMVLGLQMVSYLIFALWGEPTGLTLSACIFALTAWAVPAIMATVCGDLVGPLLAPAAFGFLTAWQGLGQATGPYAGGALGDSLPTFKTTYLVIAAMAFLGMIGTTLLRKKPAETETTRPTTDAGTQC